jgi:hypothetical protein
MSARRTIHIENERKVVEFGDVVVIIPITLVKVALIP